MKEISTEKRVATYMIQRFRMPHTAIDGKWQKFFAELKKYKECADEIWFSTGIGFPSLDWHRRHSARLAEFAEECRAAGINPGIEIQAIIGHGDGLAFCEDISGMNWDGYVGRNGARAKACGCPSDPRLRDYFVEVAKIYAAWQPSSLWIDDDFATRGRTSDPVGHEPYGHGCYCERCLAGFYKTIGKSWESRESFVEALDSDADLSDKWMEYNYRTLASVAADIAEAVHATSPKTRMGYQHGASTYTNRQLLIYEALHKATGLPVGSRPGGGAYVDHFPFDIVEKTFHEGIQLRALGMPDFIDPVCPEIENCPRTFSCKTLRGMETEALLALGIGMNSLSFFATDATLEEPASYGEWIFKPLAERAKFFRDYIDESAGTVPTGVAISSFDKPPTFGAILGIPLLGGLGRKTGAVILEDAARKLPENELFEFLREGAILDGAAAFELLERGFGEKLGGLRINKIVGSFREDFTDDPINADLPSKQTSAACLYAVEAPNAESVRVLGTCSNFKGEKVGDATVIVTTREGLNFCVLGVGTFTGITATSGRIIQLSRIAEVLSGEKLPLRLASCALAITFARTNADGSFASAVVCNPRIDDLENCTLKISGVKKSAALYWRSIRNGETRLVCEERAPGDEEKSAALFVRLPRLAPWESGYIIAK